MPEKVEYRTPEEKEACDLIRHIRKYNRTMYAHKTLTTRVDNIDEKIISSITSIHVHKKTGDVQVAGYLYFCYNTISPTKNKKLKCTNKHGLDALRQNKERLKYIHEVMKPIDFNTHIEKNIFIRENLFFNIKSGNVSITSYFYPSNNTKLKFIDEMVI